MSDKEKTNKIDHETAKAEYDRWCSAWKIGKKRKRLKGEDLEQVEAQELMIIELIEDGFLSMDDKNVLQYKLEEPIEAFSSLSIKRPKGDMLMEGDRFDEKQTIHKAYAMVAAATGYDSKVIMKMEYNTDITNLMAVIGHFLTA
jgi:hypothetical protein